MTATSAPSVLHQRQRQADVIVQVALVLHDRVAPLRNAAIVSFVVVLPALPVIAITLVPTPSARVRQVLKRLHRVADLDQRTLRKADLKVGLYLPR